MERVLKRVGLAKRNSANTNAENNNATVCGAGKTSHQRRRRIKAATRRRSSQQLAAAREAELQAAAEASAHVGTDQHDVSASGMSSATALYVNMREVRNDDDADVELDAGSAPTDEEEDDDDKEQHLTRRDAALARCQQRQSSAGDSSRSSARGANTTTTTTADAGGAGGSGRRRRFYLDTDSVRECRVCKSRRLLSGRLCHRSRKKCCCEDAVLCRSNSFKFQRFERDEAATAAARARLAYAQHHSDTEDAASAAPGGSTAVSTHVGGTMRSGGRTTMTGVTHGAAVSCPSGLQQSMGVRWHDSGDIGKGIGSAPLVSLCDHYSLPADQVGTYVNYDSKRSGAAIGHGGVDFSNWTVSKSKEDNAHIEVLETYSLPKDNQVHSQQVSHRRDASQSATQTRQDRGYAHPYADKSDSDAEPPPLCPNRRLLAGLLSRSALAATTSAVVIEPLHSPQQPKHLHSPVENFLDSGQAPDTDSIAKPIPYYYSDLLKKPSPSSATAPLTADGSCLVSSKEVQAEVVQSQQPEKRDTKAGSTSSRRKCRKADGATGTCDTGGHHHKHRRSRRSSGSKGGSHHHGSSKSVEHKHYHQHQQQQYPPDTLIQPIPVRPYSYQGAYSHSPFDVEHAQRQLGPAISSSSSSAHHGSRCGLGELGEFAGEWGDAADECLSLILDIDIGQINGEGDGDGNGSTMAALADKDRAMMMERQHQRQHQHMQQKYRRGVYETAFDSRISRSDDDLDQLDRVSQHPVLADMLEERHYAAHHRRQDHHQPPLHLQQQQQYHYQQQHQYHHHFGGSSTNTAGTSSNSALSGASRRPRYPATGSATAMRSSRPPPSQTLSSYSLGRRRRAVERVGDVKSVLSTTCSTSAAATGRVLSISALSQRLQELTLPGYRAPIVTANSASEDNDLTASMGTGGGGVVTLGYSSGHSPPLLSTRFGAVARTYGDDNPAVVHQQQSSSRSIQRAHPTSSAPCDASTSTTATLHVADICVPSCSESGGRIAAEITGAKPGKSSPTNSASSALEIRFADDMADDASGRCGGSAALASKQALPLSLAVRPSTSLGVASHDAASVAQQHMKDLACCSGSSSCGGGVKKSHRDDVMMVMFAAKQRGHAKRRSASNSAGSGHHGRKDRSRPVAAVASSGTTGAGAGAGVGVRGKYSSTESINTTMSSCSAASGGSRGSIDSLKSSTSEGNRSTTSSESRNSCSISSHSADDDSDSGAVSAVGFLNVSSGAGSGASSVVPPGCSLSIQNRGSAKLHVLSPISDKSSQEPFGDNTSDNIRNNNSHKSSPDIPAAVADLGGLADITTGSAPGATSTTGATATCTITADACSNTGHQSEGTITGSKSRRRGVAPNKNLLNLGLGRCSSKNNECQGSDSGISIQSRDGVMGIGGSSSASSGGMKLMLSSGSGFLSAQETSTNDAGTSGGGQSGGKLQQQNLLRLGFGDELGLGTICTSGSATSMDLGELPFDMPKLRRRLRVQQSGGGGSGGGSAAFDGSNAIAVANMSQASSSQSVVETERQTVLRPKLALNLSEFGLNRMPNLVLAGLSTTNPKQTAAGSRQRETVDISLPLEKQAWFHGSITRVEAENVLRLLGEGSFLVRNSESTKQDYSLSLKSARGYMHMRIQRSEDGGLKSFILGQFSKPFTTVPEMIRHFSLNGLPIRGAEHMCLIQPVVAQIL